MKIRTRTFVGIVAALAVASLAAGPTMAAAQEAPPSQVRLLTPYLGVAVEPGDSSTLNLDLQAPPGDEVELEIADLPSGWEAHIRGGAFLVDRVMVDESLNPNLRLEVDVPTGAAEGVYPVSVVARGRTSSDRIDFTFTVDEAASGGVSLDTSFPALRGPSDVQFSFTLELANNTGEEIEFGLEAQGPAGWQVTAGPAGQSRASTVTVAAGGSDRVNVTADPPTAAAAGVYQLVVQASGGGETASSQLSVEITGTYDLALMTPDDRLNLDVQAGKATELTLQIVNRGSAPLTDVSLTATPPRGWQVDSSPASVARIEPGSSAEVTAIVTPSSDAITGDYRISLKASVPEASDSIELRATVETSAVWGFVGIAVIVVALGALGLVFRRFGRR